MASPRFLLARRRAAELLQQARIRRAPVPVDRLARLAGAEIHYEPFDGEVSGLLHRQQHGPIIIGVNSAHATTRQRFTIAHELGHLVLHRDETFHVDERPVIRFRNQESSQATNAEEVEANQFASELLMPDYLLSKELSRLPADMSPEDAVSVLAKRFQVSEQALTLRLTRSGVLA
jgi:Zn-dependent peptidase ImmA (M78 family)